MRCAECNAELAPAEKFCGECGHLVKVPAAAPASATLVTVGTCPSCSAQVDAGKRFCSTCGYDLTEAVAKRPSATASPPVGAAPSVAATTSSSSIRLVLIVGIVTVVATFLLTITVVGLWMWLGRGAREANQNTASRAPTGTPVNANAREMNVSVAGNWNCEIKSSDGTLNGPMILTQNGPAITGTISTEEGTTAIAGTFERQTLSLTFPKGVLPLTLSPDGLTLQGAAEEGGNTVTVVCRR